MKENDQQPREDSGHSDESRRGCALGKCVSASHLPRAPSGPPPRLSRSTAYILSTDCGSINITKVSQLHIKLYHYGNWGAECLNSKFPQPTLL